MSNIKVLINEEELNLRIKELASLISKDYDNKMLTIICILKGSIYFTTELTKNIENDLELEFIRVSSYGANTVSSGKIELKIDLDSNIEGKDIIIIEDIIDTGRTLYYLKEHLLKKNPNSLKICTLLDKKERRVMDIEADYVAFDVPDKFVVGYGLDIDEKYRNLPYIGYIE